MCDSALISPHCHGSHQINHKLDRKMKNQFSFFKNIKNMMFQSRQYLFLPLGVSKGPSVLYDTKVAKLGLEPTRHYFMSPLQ